MPNTSSETPKRWVVAASYFDGDESRWLDDFIHDDAISFRKTPAPRSDASWHIRKRLTTGVSHWLSHVRQVHRTFAQQPDGIITSFPPLAIVGGIMKRFRRSDVPIIAYTFNLGSLPPGVRQRMTRFAARAIDVFVVHSPAEIEPYAAYLGVPSDRVRFAPLQRGAIDVARDEDTENPFILALGSAHRDYPTLIAAVDALEIPTVIVTRPIDIDALPSSPWVTYETHLSQDDCDDLLARARLSVTPISNLQTASGQITLVTAMRLGVPAIATRCPGSKGYIADGDTGMLVEPGSIADMQAKIGLLWHDTAAREALGTAACADAEVRFTDEVAAARLHDLIVEVSSTSRHRRS